MSLECLGSCAWSCRVVLGGDAEGLNSQSHTPFPWAAGETEWRPDKGSYWVAPRRGIPPNPGSVHEQDLKDPPTLKGKRSPAILLSSVWELHLKLRRKEEQFNVSCLALTINRRHSSAQYYQVYCLLLHLSGLLKNNFEEWFLCFHINHIE